MDSDIGTIISGATDKLFRVHDDPEYFLHLDFESGHFRAELPLRLRLYNSVFEYRHQRVVMSVPVLLRPEADSPQWNGLLERGFPGQPPVSTLRYDVIRVWQLSAEQLLTGGAGTLALAPISNVAASDVRRVIRRMKERLEGPKGPRKAADIWAATYVLLGLRYSDEFAHALFEEVLGMEESATYRAIVRAVKKAGKKAEGRGGTASVTVAGRDEIWRGHCRCSGTARTYRRRRPARSLGRSRNDRREWQELLSLPPPAGMADEKARNKQRGRGLRVCYWACAIRTNSS